MSSSEAAREAEIAAAEAWERKHTMKRDSRPFKPGHAQEKDEEVNTAFGLRVCAWLSRPASTDRRDSARVKEKACTQKRQWKRASVRAGVRLHVVGGPFHPNDHFVR
jgi:hypothetical protein